MVDLLWDIKVHKLHPECTHPDITGWLGVRYEVSYLHCYSYTTVPSMVDLVWDMKLVIYTVTVTQTSPGWLTWCEIWSYLHCYSYTNVPSMVDLVWDTKLVIYTVTVTQTSPAWLTGCEISSYLFTLLQSHKRPRECTDPVITRMVNLVWDVKLLRVAQTLQRDYELVVHSLVLALLLNWSS